MNKKRMLTGLISLGMFFTITGCGKVPKLQNGEEVVASLNGKDFTANELYEKLRKQGGTSVLVNMVDNFIVGQEITDDKEATEYATALIKQYKLNFKQNNQNFEEALINQGYANENELKEELIEEYKKKSIAEKYIKESITEDELKKFYDEHISDELSVKHILISPEINQDSSDEEKTNAENAALEKAKKLIEQINNGADFDTLAKENSSDDATKNNGGAINNVVKEGYVTEFWNAAYELEKGTYTKEPVKSQYGYHIIYKVDHTPKKSLDEMKESLYDKIVAEKISDDAYLIQKTWVKIREKYNLKINDSSIDSLYNSSIKNLEKVKNG